MILVVDITKGMQTQTAECLVIGEITCDHMIIVLNKVDLIPQEKREAQVEKVRISVSDHCYKSTGIQSRGKCQSPVCQRCRKSYFIVQVGVIPSSNFIQERQTLLCVF
jgi:translation initiation factor 2 gamma subunit (eIF-2gamma)